jgi:hypothetical protein
MDTARGDGGGGPTDGDRYREYSMSPRQTERSPAGRTTSPAGSGANRWWGRAVVACASLAALAGTVAAVATAAGADSEQAGRTEARDAADASRVPAPAPVPAADTAAVAPSLAPVRPAPGPQRAGAPGLGATLAVPPGWQVAPGQDLVPVAPDRFPTVLTLADRATVALGRLDPARGTGPDALADEARRLVGAFADGAMGRTPGERGRITDVSDAGGTLDGRDAHTVVRRVTTSDGPGPLVRVTTVAAGRGAPGLVLLAVAAPGPQQAADGTAADRVVRSLAAAVPPGRSPAAGGRAGAPPASASRPPGSPPPGRPVSPPPARPTPTDR